ncbi:MAG: CDP-diacylglycerol--glycerol-3-phosphate 3-phosphatidyltransferase [Planctomycetota bacterium]
MTVPNILTLFRLASAPVFLALFIGSGKDGFLPEWLSGRAGLIACLIVMSASEISDILDGILARHLNQVSDFGKILDPYADSTFRLSVFFAFASQAHGKWIPIWMVMVLFYRDMLVTVIRAFGIERREFVHARSSGKIKAIAQGTAIFLVLGMAVLYGENLVAMEPATKGAEVTSLAHTLMWVVTVVTVWSGIDYFYANRHLFQNTQKSKV